MIQLEGLCEFPHINVGDDLCSILINYIKTSQMELLDNDILCIASKVVSLAEKRIIRLSDITPSELAINISQRIPRKDPRVIQLIIDETKDATGSKLDISGNYIGAWLPSGLKLTSAGVDRLNNDYISLLPESPDESARKIGTAIYNSFGVNVAILITDSDGRIDKRGATQIAVGSFGLPPLRITKCLDTTTGKTKNNEETVCDMLAAASALIMGQRGTNKPIVRVRGVSYKFDKEISIKTAIAKND